MLDFVICTNDETWDADGNFREGGDYNDLSETANTTYVDAVVDSLTEQLGADNFAYKCDSWFPNWNGGKYAKGGMAIFNWDDETEKIIDKADAAGWAAVEKLKVELDKKRFVITCKKCGELFHERKDFMRENCELDENNSLEICCPNCCEAATYTIENCK